MKLFATAAIGAALLAGCAPFEHGHYAQDVSFQNTSGDAPGTPLVYNTLWDSRSGYPVTTDVASTSIPVHRAGGQLRYKQADYAIPGYTTHNQPASYVATDYTPIASVPQHYSTAVQPNYQPTYQTTASYVQPATQSTYSGSHAGHAHSQHSVHATSYGGVRFDADGYAICDIPFPSHGAHERPRY